MKRRASSRWRRLIQVVLTMLAAVAVGEGAFRLLWPQLFPLHPPGMLRPDPIVGHTLAPGFSGSFQRAEFDVQVDIDQSGFRGRWVSGDPKVRILCLGDSVTWGWGVDQNATFPALLYRRLGGEQAAAGFEVANAGTPFFGTNDELALLRTRIADYAPDIVIIQFNAANDFEQNNISASERHYFEGGVLFQERAFEAATAPRWLDALNWLKHQSHLIRFVSERAGMVAMNLNWLGTWEAASSDHFSTDERARTQELLRDTISLADANSATVVVLFIPEKLQILGQRTLPLRASVAIGEVAAERGNGFVDVTSAFMKHNNPASLFGKNEGFVSAAGHALIADELTPVIARRIE